MSRLTVGIRSVTGDQNYEDMKAVLFGSETSYVKALPKDNGISTVFERQGFFQHSERREKVHDDWRPLAVGASILLFSFYLFQNRT